MTEEVVKRKRGRPKGSGKFGGRVAGSTNIKLPPIEQKLYKIRHNKRRKSGLRKPPIISPPMTPSESEATPLEFMLGLMNDHRQPMGLRLKAAMGAAPYCHARHPEIPAKQPLPAYDREATLAALDAAFSEITQSEPKQLAYGEDEKEVA